MIESCFGILSVHSEILQKSIRASAENVKKYMLACLALHNYQRLTDNGHNMLTGFIDPEEKNGDFIPGEWWSQNENPSQDSSFKEIKPVGGSRPPVVALNVRNQLKGYLNSNEGSLSWIKLCSQNITLNGISDHIDCCGIFQGRAEAG